MTVNHHDIVISRRDFLQGNEMETRWKQCIIIFQKCPKMSKNVQKMKLFNPEFLKIFQNSKKKGMPFAQKMRKSCFMTFNPITYCYHLRCELNMRKSCFKRQ